MEGPGERVKWMKTDSIWIMDMSCTVGSFPDDEKKGNVGGGGV